MKQMTGLSNELDLLGWLIRYGKNDLSRQAIEEQILCDYGFMFRIRGQAAIDFLKFASASSDSMSREFIKNMGYGKKPHEIVMDYLYTIRNYQQARLTLYKGPSAKRRRIQAASNIAARVACGRGDMFYLVIDLELFSGFKTLYRRLGI